MKKSLKKIALGFLALVLPCLGWSAEITEVIAINFASERVALDTNDTTTKLGYVSTDGLKGAQVTLDKWNNVAGNNGNAIEKTVTVKSVNNEQTYNLAFDIQNTYFHGNDTSAIGKLTGGYFDVPNYDGGQLPTISLAQMPTTGYDVAVILSGDGGSFSGVTVNGTTYMGSTVDNEGVTIVGNGSWGTRSSSSTLEEGKNVLYISYQRAETLTITGLRDHGGRSSIAGLMVFFREVAVSEATVSNETTTTSEIAWTQELTESSEAILTAKTEAMLEMDAPIAVARLITQGSKITFTAPEENAKSLTANSVVVNADTDVSAIEASLGAVTIAAGKKFTVKTPSVYDGLSFASGTSTIAYKTTDTVSDRVTLTPAGGTLEVTSGTYSNVTLGINATATTINFVGGDMTFNDQMSFGTATVNISGGTYTTPKLVTVQDGNGRSSTITQTGGNITINGTDEGNGNGASLLLGHWGGSATSTYNLNGGTLTAENASLRLGHDSGATLNINGGTLKVKGVRGRGNYTTSVNLQNGKLSLGAYNWPAISNQTVTLSGGELNAFDDASIAQNLTISGNVSMSADAGKTLTITSTLSADNSHTITKSGDGIVNLSSATLPDTLQYVVNAGTLILPASAKDALVNVTSGTLKLCVTQEQVVEEITASNVTLPDGENIIFVLPSGLEIEGEGKVLSAQNYYTYTTTETNPTWETRGNWTLNGAALTDADALPGVDANVVISAPNGTTLTLADAKMVKSLLIQGGAVTLSGGSLTTEALKLDAALTVNNALTINSKNTEGYPLTLAATDKLTISSAGTLTTKGYIDITGGAYNGNFVVASGKTIYRGVDRKLKGTHTIEAGATLVNTNTDALDYGQGNDDGSGVTTTNVKGTLDLGTSRWSINLRNKINIYNGAEIRGAGDGNKALHFFSNNTITFDGEANVTPTATISATVKMRDASETLTIELPNDGSLAMSGEIVGDGKLNVSSGTTVLSATNTYIGGTEIAAGATVTITNANALGSGTITGAGTLKCVEVLPANKTGLNAAAWTGTVLIKDFSGTLNQDSSGGSNAQIGGYGHEGSTIVLDNVKAYILNGVNAKSVTLTGEGFQPNNGSSTSLATVTIDKLKGDGALKGATGNSAFKYRFNITDATEFTGTINLATDKGSATSIYFGEDANATVDAGTIVVAETETVSIARGKTWRAYTDKSVIVSGTIGGTGTIGSALTFNDGATLDASAGALTVEGTIAWPTTTDANTVKVKVSEWNEGSAVVVLRGVEEIPTGTTFALVNYAGESLSGGYTANLSDGYLVLTYGEESQIPTTEVDAELTTTAESMSWVAIAGGAYVKTGENTSLTITFTEDNQTFTFDNKLPLTFTSITVNAENGVDTSTCKIVSGDGAATVTAGSTNVDTSVDVSALNVSSLGAVTIAAGKTLTMDGGAIPDSLSGTGTLVLNISDSITPNEADCEKLRAFPGSVTFTSSNAGTGTTLNHGSSRDDSLQAQYIFDGGTHHLTYGVATGTGYLNFAIDRENPDDNPAVWVKNGATVTWNTADLSGWNGSTLAQQVIRVDNASLTFVDRSGGTEFFRNRLLLGDKARVTISADKFHVYGGVGDSATDAQIAMVASEAGSPAMATITGSLQSGGYTGGGGYGDKGMGIAVGANSTLDIKKLLGDKPIVKYGEGTLLLSTTENTFNNTMTVKEGVLKLTGSLNCTTTISAGATLAGTGTLNGTLTFADGATLDASAGALTANSVTWNGSVVIQVPEDFSDWTTGVKVLGTATTLPTNYTLMQGGVEVKTLMLVAKTVNDVAGIYAVEPTVSADVTNVDVAKVIASNLTAIKAAAAAKKVQTVASIVGATIGDKTVDVAGLELFDNVAVTVTPDVNDATTGTATVDYAFGITSIGLDAERKVTVTAKVNTIAGARAEANATPEAPAVLTNSTTLPTFAEGVTVKLYQVVTTTNAGMETTTSLVEIPSTATKEDVSTITVTSNESILGGLGTNPSLTKPLTIKAVKTQQP